MDIFNVEELLKAVGAAGLFAIVFAESGLLIGFFLPGDTLLFTAGLFSLKGDLPALWFLILGCSLAAIVGDQVGYIIGSRMGPALFKRPNSMFFKAENIAKAHSFFERHGGKTVVLARFIPLIRTFTPVVAGAGSMRYRSFVFYNVFGGILWCCGGLTAGYLFGEAVGVETIDKYMLPIMGAIVVASFGPMLLELYKSRRGHKNALTESDLEAIAMAATVSAGEGPKES